MTSEFIELDTIDSPEEVKIITRGKEEPCANRCKDCEFWFQDVQRCPYRMATMILPEAKICEKFKKAILGFCSNKASAVDEARRQLEEITIMTPMTPTLSPLPPPKSILPSSRMIRESKDTPEPQPDLYKPNRRKVVVVDKKLLPFQELLLL